MAAVEMLSGVGQSPEVGEFGQRLHDQVRLDVVRQRLVEAPHPDGGCADFGGGSDVVGNGSSDVQLLGGRNVSRALQFEPVIVIGLVAAYILGGDELVEVGAQFAHADRRGWLG